MDAKLLDFSLSGLVVLIKIRHRIYELEHLGIDSLQHNNVMAAGAFFEIVLSLVAVATTHKWRRSRRHRIWHLKMP